MVEEVKDSLSKDVVIFLEQQGIELFSDSEQKAYATFNINSRAQTLLVESSRFASLVSAAYYRAHKAALSKYSLEKSVEILKAKALYDGKTEEVFLRVAPIEGGFELDLNNERGECVKVTSAGWEISLPSRKFLRPEGALALPKPETGGNPDLLWKYLNVAKDDRVLMMGWLLASFNPHGPFPLLIIQGEQNCAKSTTMSNLRALIDPAKADRAGMVKNVREIFGSTSRNWIMSFDNLQAISDEISDAFCRLATGGAHKERRLHVNGEEFVIQATRPIILNGIEDIASRPDLESRAIILNLPKLTERKAEMTLLAEFEYDKPKILGILMDALMNCVKTLGGKHDHPTLRFPSVVGWIAASEVQLGFEAGAFEQAWRRNQEQAKLQNLDLDPVARCIIHLMRQVEGETWIGSAAELLARLEHELPDGKAKPVTWPRSARQFSGHLSRVANNLAEVGIEYSRPHREAKLRPIALTKLGRFDELTVMFVTTEQPKEVKRNWPDRVLLD